MYNYNTKLIIIISLCRWGGSNGSTVSGTSGASGRHRLLSERVLLLRFFLSRCNTRFQFGASTSRSSSSIRTGSWWPTDGMIFSKSVCPLSGSRC